MLKKSMIVYLVLMSFAGCWLTGCTEQKDDGRQDAILQMIETLREAIKALSDLNNRLLDLLEIKMREFNASGTPVITPENATETVEVDGDEDDGDVSPATGTEEIATGTEPIPPPVPSPFPIDDTASGSTGPTSDDPVENPLPQQGPAGN